MGTCQNNGPPFTWGAGRHALLHAELDAWDRKETDGKFQRLVL